MTKDFDPEQDLKFTIDNELKKIFEKDKVEAGDETSSMLTSTITETNYKFQVEKIKHRIIFFDHKQTFFKDIMKEIKDKFEYNIIEELETLPKRLGGSERKILFLYYSGYPRLCNQMIPLVRTKFPSVVIVMVAKRLTAEKVEEHRKSDLAADDYLSVPFSREDLLRVVIKHHN